MFCRLGRNDGASCKCVSGCVVGNRSEGDLERNWNGKDVCQICILSKI